VLSGNWESKDLKHVQNILMGMTSEEHKTYNCVTREIQNAVNATGCADGTLILLFFYLTQGDKKEMKNESV